MNTNSMARDMTHTIARKRLFALYLGALVVIGTATFTSVAAAQGLKLGGDTEETAAPKIDLGAKKPAAQPQKAEVAIPKSGSNNPNATKYGSWEVACGPEGGNCAMAQIGKDTSGTPVLEMVIRKLKEPLEADGRTATAVLDIITPLGVVLTSGLSLQIDGGAAEAAPFQICTEQGCLVREPVDDQLIGRLKAGGNAKVTVVAANQGDVSSTISLSGFTKAFNSLR